MKLQPVAHHNTHYPDKYEVDLNRLLLSHKPNRWKSASVALLLSTLCASSFAGCTPTGKTGTVKDGPTQNGVRTMRIAPLFGNEIPSNVTMGYAPSHTAMTEREASKIIRDALKDHGIDSKTSTGNATVAGKDKDFNWSFDLSILGTKEPVYAEFITSKTLETDEELSERDAAGLPEEPFEAAGELREKLAEVKEESTGVIFYVEDCVFYNEEEYLRSQVDDFVQWLKTEGLI